MGCICVVVLLGPPGIGLSRGSWSSSFSPAMPLPGACPCLTPGRVEPELPPLSGLGADLPKHECMAGCREGCGDIAGIMVLSAKDPHYLSHHRFCPRCVQEKRKKK